MVKSKFTNDFNFGIKSEMEVADMIRTFGRNVIHTSDTDILDFKIIDKNGNEVWLELKTRRCNKEDYPDTMIGINKLIEAYTRYNSSGAYTLFVFKFQDGTYIINPFLVLPRFDFRRGRWDRGDMDKPKAWCFYPTSELKRIDIQSENSIEN